MAFDAHKNFAISTVATAPSPATSGTSLVVASGEGTRFPAVSFNAVVWPTGTNPTPANAEVVRVTAISTDTFTITRAQESSTARAIVVGDQIADAVTAKTLTDIEQDVPIGSSQLVYRYTVAGSDKASIDTGVDTPDAGSNVWTDGDLLEIHIIARTDDAGANPSIDLLLNNDSGANYDVEHIFANSSTATAGGAAASSSIALHVHGSGGSASYPGAAVLEIPAYAKTDFFKTIRGFEGQVDATAGNRWSILRCWGWRSTAAITRVKIAGQSTAKLKVGSQLLIYKRKAS